MGSQNKYTNPRINTNRRSYFMHRIGVGIILISLCFLFSETKMYIIPGLVLGVVCLYLSLRWRNKKAPEGVEFDDDGNVKPTRL